VGIFASYPGTARNYLILFKSESAVVELGKTSLILDEYSVTQRVLGNFSLKIPVKPLFLTK
jgi:hypothetical protein